jgi:hypothetical protein
VQCKQRENRDNGSVLVRGSGKMSRLYAIDTKTASGKGKLFDSFLTKDRAILAAKDWLKENPSGRVIILQDAKIQPEIGIQREYVETWISEQVWESVLTGKVTKTKIKKLEAKND